MSLTMSNFIVRKNARKVSYQLSTPMFLQVFFIVGLEKLSIVTN